MSAPHAWARFRASMDGVELLQLTHDYAKAQARLLYHYYQRLGMRRHLELTQYLPRILYAMSGVSPDVDYRKRTQSLEDVIDASYYSMGHLMFHDEAYQEHLRRKADVEAQMLDTVSMFDSSLFSLDEIGWNLEDFVWPTAEFDWSG